MYRVVTTNGIEIFRSEKYSACESTWEDWNGIWEDMDGNEWRLGIEEVPENEEETATEEAAAEEKQEAVQAEEKLVSIKKLYNRYLEVKAEQERIDNALEADLTNDELEKQSDEYYENVFYPAFRELLTAVAELTNSKPAVAREMIDTPKFKNLMDKVH